jgi:hypothetical protein
MSESEYCPPEARVRLVRTPDGAEPPPEPEEIEAEVAARRAREVALRPQRAGAEDGIVHGPTRAEIMLAVLQAFVFAPIPAALAGGLLDSTVSLATIEKRLAMVKGQASVALFGTAFVAIFIALLASKARARRLEDVRVLVFEPGRSWGAKVLVVVALVEMGILEMLWKR